MTQKAPVKTNNTQVAAHLNQQGATVNSVTAYEDNIRVWFRTNGTKLRSLCGNKEMADRILVAAMNTIQKIPTIVECSPTSFCSALMQCAEFNLMPGFSGEAYILPFKNNKNGGKKDATFVLGYNGTVQLLYRSAMVKDIEAEIVCEKDYFHFTRGSGRKLEFEPAEGTLDERGAWLGAYVIIRNIFGGEHIAYMSAKDILAIKNRAPAGDSAFSPWNSKFANDRAWMWLKCPLKAAAKLSPKSTKSNLLIQALAADNDGSPKNDVPTLPTLPATTAGKLSAADLEETSQGSDDGENGAPGDDDKR